MDFIFGIYYLYKSPLKGEDLRKGPGGLLAIFFILLYFIFF